MDYPENLHVFFLLINCFLLSLLCLDVVFYLVAVAGEFLKGAAVGGTVRFSCGDPSCALDRTLIIIITYIYHALINALSSHIIHISLKLIFYTHVEHSPIKNNLHKVLYGNAINAHCDFSVNFHCYQVKN